MKSESFKRAIGKFPTGVCIVSVAFNDKLWGFTANSISSVSLNPPLVLFCLDKNSRSFYAFKNANYFNISILASDQSEISKQFASNIIDKFLNINFKLGKYGCPLIKDSASILECKKFKEMECGDHFIFIGEVLKTEVDDTKLPLVYFAKSYKEIN